MLLPFLAVHFDSAPVSLNNEDVLIDVIVGSATSCILSVQLSLGREVREYNQLRVGVVPAGGRASQLQHAAPQQGHERAQRQEGHGKQHEGHEARTCAT
jgi:hypothetical protein